MNMATQKEYVQISGPNITARWSLHSSKLYAALNSMLRNADQFWTLLAPWFKGLYRDLVWKFTHIQKVILDSLIRNDRFQELGQKIFVICWKVIVVGNLVQLNREYIRIFEELQCSLKNFDVSSIVDWKHWQTLKTFDTHKDWKRS